MIARAAEDVVVALQFGTHQRHAQAAIPVTIRTADPEAARRGAAGLRATDTLPEAPNEPVVRGTTGSPIGSRPRRLAGPYERL